MIELDSQQKQFISKFFIEFKFSSIKALFLKFVSECFETCASEI
jgi:hypothetical protein